MIKAKLIGIILGGLMLLGGAAGAGAATFRAYGPNCEQRQCLTGVRHTQTDESRPTDSGCVARHQLGDIASSVANTASKRRFSS